MLSYLAGCLLVVSPASTLAEALDFNAALAQMNERSDQRAASRHAVRSAELRREAMEGLGGPSVYLSGTGYAYSANLSLDLDALQRAEAGLSAQLPPLLGGGTAPLPQLPDRYTRFMSAARRMPRAACWARKRARRKPTTCRPKTT